MRIIALLLVFAATLPCGVFLRKHDNRHRNQNENNR